MALKNLGFDEHQGVTMYRCDECGEMYGKLPGSVPLKHCARCKEREATKRLKQRIYEAQKSLILLATEIQQHRQSVEESEYEIMPWDQALYDLLDVTAIPIDAPSGVLAVIEGNDEPPEPRRSKK